MRGAMLVPLLLLALRMTAAEAVPAWRTESDRRIETHRKGDFTLTVRGQDGQPLAGVPVSLRLVRHRFMFGGAVTPLLFGDSRDADRYRAAVHDHFDTLVCENEMKWYHIEKERGQRRFASGDALLAYAERHGMRMRGHCLFWGRLKFVRFQPWVEALPAPELRAAMEDHLAATVPRWRGRLAAWDVNNEMLDGAFYAERLGEDIDAWMFRRAHELDPATPMFVNEFGILDSDEKTARYLALIERLRAAGAPVGGIGIQEHAAERFVPDTAAAAADADQPERQGRGPLIPDEVWGRLDRFAATGLPIHLTEISSRTASDERRADTLEMLFRVGFAHPGVEAILLWGFWSQQHWLGRDAALYDKAWRPLPAAERLRHLVRVEWTTTVEAVTDAAGTVRFRGFHGRYRVAAAPAGAAVAGELELGPDRPAGAVQLQP